MDFHDFPMSLGKIGCVAHPPPKVYVQALARGSAGSASRCSPRGHARSAGVIARVDRIPATDSNGIGPEWRWSIFTPCSIALPYCANYLQLRLLLQLVRRALQVSRADRDYSPWTARSCGRDAYGNPLRICPTCQF